MKYPVQDSCFFCAEKVDISTMTPSCCPLCKDRRNLVFRKTEVLSGQFRVVCAECGTGGDPGYTKEAAISNFNEFNDAYFFVNQWNESHPGGVWLTHFPTFSNDEPTEFTVNQPAYLLGKLAVIPINKDGIVVTLERVEDGRYRDIEQEVKLQYGNPRPGTRERAKRQRKASRSDQDIDAVVENTEDSFW